MGMRKPDAEIYTTLINRHELSPKRTLFVDDKKDNTDAAKALGLHVWIVLGRHLIAMGHKPAGWFSQVLDEAFEAQLDGVFGDEAGGLAWLTERMAKGVV